MQFEELVTLIKTVSESELSSFEYEESGLKIAIKGKKCVKEAAPAVTTVVPAMMPQMMQPSVMPMAPAMSVPEMPAAAPAAAEAQPEVSIQADGCEMITSPLVGVFYAAPAEDAAPYVKVGDTVKKGQIVAIVEAMKLMNEIEAECDGVVSEILVKNAQSVEYGQPLFAIKTN